MKLSTAIIQTIEMTRDEEDRLWDSYLARTGPISICNKRIANWDTGDGNNAIHLEGEHFYRQVKIIA